MTKTEEMLLLEKAKDSKWFRERFFWIVNKEARKVPYLLNPPQEIYYKNQTQFDLILKSRKEGFSSEIEGDFVFDCMTKENTHAVTMAHTLDDTKVHLNRIKYYIQTCGTQNVKFEISLDKENEKEIYFPITQSYYWIGTAGSTGWGRGRDVNRLHCSEVSHYEDQSVLTSVLEACTTNAKRRLETTANGVGELFHQLWEEAGDDKSGSPWKQHFFAWFQDLTNVMSLHESIKFVLSPEELNLKKLIYQRYKVELTNEQVMWYRMKRLSMADRSLMPQEYPSTAEEAFISSGRHVFSLPKLDIMRSRTVEPGWVGDLNDDGHTVEFISNPEGHLSIWKNPRQNANYLISADVAKGISDGAFSVAAIFDRSSWEVVAEWRARINPESFGEVLAGLGYYYNNALLAPENNNHGQATLARIKEVGYPHILKTSDLWADEKHPDLGFPTNEKTKHLAVNALRNAIDNLTYYENSRVAIREMERSVWDDSGKIVSQVGIKNKGGSNAFNDKGFLDCMITRAIGIYCLKFLTLDETYRQDEAFKKPLLITSIVGRHEEKSRFRSSTGYR